MWAISEVKDCLRDGLRFDPTVGYNTGVVAHVLTLELRQLQI